MQKEDRLSELRNIVKHAYNWQYRFLNFCGNDINDDDMAIMIENGVLDDDTQYLQFNSGSIKITAKSIRLLIEYLPNLCILHVTTSHLLDETIWQEINAIKRLSQLQIGQVHPDHCIDLMKISSLAWQNLYCLTIYCNNLGTKAYKYLSRSSMPKLSTLQTSNISNYQMLHLAKAQWPNLSNFNLYSNRITIHAISTIIKGNWKALKCLNISYSPFLKKIFKDPLLHHQFRPDCQFVGDFIKKKPLPPLSKKQKKKLAKLHPPL